MLNISVIVPVYNAEAFLSKAVNSALQFDEVKEIILIEDKSTDNSLELCRKLATESPKIKLFQHPNKGNHGAGASRNLGLEKASQEFISFLDADDYYLPNRFEAEKKLFKDKKIEGVFGAIGTEFLTEKGKKEFQEKFYDAVLTTVKFPAEGMEVFLGLMGFRKDFGHFFHLNTLTLRMESVRKNNLIFNEKLRVHQDTDFIVKLSYHLFLKSGIIHKAVAIRGVHDDNRITKVKLYSTPYFKNMFLLYESRYIWSRQQKELSSKLKSIIKKRYISYKIANNRGLGKYFSYFANVILNPTLLKTRYRFVSLKKHL